MSATHIPTPKKALADLRTGHTVAEALDAYFLSKGIAPPTREELASLPPWPKEDSDAFERVINEMFERIDEDTHAL